MSLARGLLSIGTRRGPAVAGDIGTSTGPHCPECKRAHGQHHLQDCSRRFGFVRDDGGHCIYCHSEPGKQHGRYRNEPCPHWDIPDEGNCFDRGEQ